MKYYFERSTPDLANKPNKHVFDFLQENGSERFKRVVLEIGFSVLYDLVLN